MEKEIYKYKINELNILIGKKVITLAPENILELEFNYDYDKYFFPIIRLSLNTSLDTIYSLRENPDISKVHLEMSYYIYKSEESNFDYEEEFINLTLNTFISDLTPELQRHLNKISREVSNDELNDFQSIIDLYLFDYNTINKTRTIVNEIFSEVNIQTVVSYLFNKANIKNVLASPSSNTNIYHQLIIPPTDSVIDALENVQNMYGIFDTTPTLFFDINKTYFIDKSGKCNANLYGEKTKTTLSISKDDKDDSMVTFTNTNKYAYEINVGINSIFMDSNSIFLDLIRGNKIKCLENETVDDFLPDTNYSNNEVIIKNQYGNKFAINSEKKAIEDNQLILYIALRDYNILSLTPNKEICVRFDDTEYQEAYGGYYRLSSHTYTFNKEGTTFRSSGAIMLLKCKR